MSHHVNQCLTRSTSVVRTEDKSGTRFRVATLAFGAQRDFQIKNEASGKVETILHKNGQVLYLPAPMNAENLHGVPKRKKVNDCRISLTFREIV